MYCLAILNVTVGTCVYTVNKNGCTFNERFGAATFQRNNSTADSHCKKNELYSSFIYFLKKNWVQVFFPNNYTVKTTLQLEKKKREAQIAIWSKNKLWHYRLTMRSSLWLGLRPDFSTENSGFYTANSVVFVTNHVGSSLTQSKKVQTLRNSSRDKTNKMNVRFFQIINVSDGALKFKRRPLNVFRERSLAEVAVKSSCKAACAFNCNQLKSCFYFSQLQKKERLSWTLYFRHFVDYSNKSHTCSQTEKKTKKTYQAIKYFP